MAVLGNALVAWTTVVGLNLCALREVLRLRRARENASSWRQTSLELTDFLTMLFFWAGAALAGMYYLTHLSWYHAYQYAIAFILAAGVAHFVGRHLRGDIRAQDNHASSIAKARGLLILTLAQSGAAILGLVFLIVLGKFGAIRADWAANHVFASAAFGVLFMSLLGLPGLYRAIKTARCPN